MAAAHQTWVVKHLAHLFDRLVDGPGRFLRGCEFQHGIYGQQLLLNLVVLALTLGGSIRQTITRRRLSSHIRKVAELSIFTIILLSLHIGIVQHSVVSVAIISG